MLENNFFLKVSVVKSSNTFTRLMWIVLLLSSILLLDLNKNSFFEGPSIVQLRNPLYLLLGPAIYFAVGTLGAKMDFFLLKHISPFFVGVIIYIIASSTFDFYHKSIYVDEIILYDYFYLLVPVSLWFYSFKVIKFLYNVKDETYSGEVELLVVTAGINIIIGVTYLLIFFFWGIFKMNMGINYHLLIYFLLFIACLFSARYLYRSNSSIPVSKVLVENKSYSNSSLKLAVAQHYQQQLIECFENSEIYLRPDISIDLLAKELGIPKHHFSQLFSVYFKKSFYSFVADYRIRYAINKMELNRGTLTLESLAYEAGFNSKTSFNHYFKKNTGVTPTDYLLNSLKNAVA